MTVYTRKQLEARMGFLESLPLGSEVEIQYTVTHEPGGEKKRGTTQTRRDVKLVSYVTQDVRSWIKSVSDASGVSESYVVQSILKAAMERECRTN
jgi:hypothetical protein